MFPLKEFVKPSSLVRQYVEDPETLTISLGSLIDFKLYNARLSIPSEVSDPLTFLQATEYHDAISGALREALSGLEQYGCKVLPLLEEMGFGKIHFLILLWHVFTDIAAKWDKVKKVRSFTKSLDSLRSVDINQEERCAQWLCHWICYKLLRGITLTISS
jgi:hypothetical protein